jgi:hypothetical protein
MKELEPPWAKLKGAPSMIGKKAGFMGRVGLEMDKQIVMFYMELHCVIHQQSPCGKTLKFDHVMKDMVSVMNFVRSHGIVSSFNLFCRKFMLNMGTPCTMKKSDC